MSIDVIIFRTGLYKEVDQLHIERQALELPKLKIKATLYLE